MGDPHACRPGLPTGRSGVGSAATGPHRLGGRPESEATEMRERILRAYARFRFAASSLKSLLRLRVRLYGGGQFAQSAWGRLHHTPQATEFSASLHIPFPAANVV